MEPRSEGPEHVDVAAQIRSGWGPDRRRLGPTGEPFCGVVSIGQANFALGPTSAPIHSKGARRGQTAVHRVYPHRRSEGELVDNRFRFINAVIEQHHDLRERRVALPRKCGKARTDTLGLVEGRDGDDNGRVHRGSARESRFYANKRLGFRPR